MICRSVHTLLRYGIGAMRVTPHVFPGTIDHQSLKPNRQEFLEKKINFYPNHMDSNKPLNLDVTNLDPLFDRWRWLLHVVVCILTPLSLSSPSQAMTDVPSSDYPRRQVKRRRVTSATAAPHRPANAGSEPAKKSDKTEIKSEQPSLEFMARVLGKQYAASNTLVWAYEPETEQYDTLGFWPCQVCRLCARQEWERGGSIPRASLSLFLHRPLWPILVGDQQQ